MFLSDVPIRGDVGIRAGERMHVVDIFDVVWARDSFGFLRSV